MKESRSLLGFGGQGRGARTSPPGAEAFAASRRESEWTRLVAVTTAEPDGRSIDPGTPAD